jgi:hypothetical protein
MGDHEYYDDRHAAADEPFVRTFFGLMPRSWADFDAKIRRSGIRFPVQDRGEKMRTNDELIAEAENLRQQAERLEEIADQRGKYGTDPFKNGTVLKVDMKYRTGNRSYAYAVVKVGGRFYLSGRMSGPSTISEPTGAGYSWDNFVAWLAQGDATVWQATGLKQVL